MSRRGPGHDGKGLEPCSPSCPACARELEDIEARAAGGLPEAKSDPVGKGMHRAPRVEEDVQGRGESEMKKRQACGNCGEIGHNAKTCGKAQTGTKAARPTDRPTDRLARRPSVNGDNEYSITIPVKMRVRVKERSGGVDIAVDLEEA